MSEYSQVPPAALESKMRPFSEPRGHQHPSEGTNPRIRDVQWVCKGMAGLPQPGSSAWNRLSPQVKQQAHQFRKALAGALELHCSGRWGRSEIEAAGLRDYQATIGHRVTARHFWRLIDQVIERDGGAKQFDNLALYLTGRLARKKQALPFEQAARELANLRSAVLGISDASRPTASEVLLVWDSALSDFQHLIDAGMSDVRARRAVIAGLDASGVPLALTRSSLAKAFCRKLERWIEGGRTPSAIRDLRSAADRRELPLTDSDRNYLLAHGLTGGLAKAWRDGIASGGLSAGVVQFYISNPASKSYVPNRVRAELGPQIEMLQKIHHGPRQAALNGAYIPRDWSDVSPADWYSADDTTLQLYYWEEGDDGRPRILRGQCLVMADSRTNRILGLALHSERNYTAKVIRGLILTVHDTYGLPREGFYFERGIWASAKLLKGAADEITSDETELGLREWVKFRHAKPGNARAKTIERIIGLMQTRMEDQPGYCGRNEQVEKFERLQRQILDVGTGHAHPRQFMLHRDEWIQRLHEICDAYNSEAQQGRMLNGISPREAWEKWFDYTRPLQRLEGPARCLLANHRRPLKVSRNGICIQVGKERCHFRNETTGSLIGRTVQVYFNPDDLSSVIIRLSANDPEAFVIPPEVSIPAMTATPEQHRAAQASVEAHNRPARTLYMAIKPHFQANAPTMFRRNVMTPEFTEQQGEIAAEQEAIRTAQKTDRRTKQQINRLERRQGITANPAVSDARRLTGLKLLEEANQDANT